MIVWDVPSGICFRYDSMNVVIQCGHVFDGIRDMPAGTHLAGEDLQDRCKNPLNRPKASLITVQGWNMCKN